MSNDVHKFLEWRNDLIPEDYPDIFQKLERLDRIETMILEGADVDAIRAELFDL